MRRRAGDRHAARRFASRTARSTSPGSRGRTSRRCAAKGVDARLVVFNRGRLHPEADWSLDRDAARLAAPARDAGPRRSRGCFRRPTSSTSTSGSRSCRSRSSSRSCARRGGRASSTTSARTSAARRRDELAYGRRADAEIVGSYDAIRWVPGGARRPAGARPAPVHAAPAVRQPAAARRPRAVEPRRARAPRT